MNGDRFREGFSLSLAKKYDLPQIDKVIVGGDGASWVKEGAEFLGSLYELDRFHSRRALHQGLVSSPLVAELYQACVIGEIDKVERLLTRAQEKADSDKAREIMRLRGYLVQNRYRLRDCWGCLAQCRSAGSAWSALRSSLGSSVMGTSSGRYEVIANVSYLGTLTYQFLRVTSNALLCLELHLRFLPLRDLTETPKTPSS